MIFLSGQAHAVLMRVYTLVSLRSLFSSCIFNHDLLAHPAFPIGACRIEMFATILTWGLVFSDVLTFHCMWQCSRSKDPRKGRISNEEAAVATGPRIAWLGKNRFNTKWRWDTSTRSASRRLYISPVLLEIWTQNVPKSGENLLLTFARDCKHSRTYPTHLVLADYSTNPMSSDYSGRSQSNAFSLLWGDHLRTPVQIYCRSIPQSLDYCDWETCNRCPDVHA